MRSRYPTDSTQNSGVFASLYASPPWQKMRYWSDDAGRNPRNRQSQAIAPYRSMKPSTDNKPHDISMDTNDRSLGEDFLAAGNPDLKKKSPDFGEFYRNASSDEIGDVNLHGEMELVGERLVWEIFLRSTSGSALYPDRKSVV